MLSFLVDDSDFRITSWKGLLCTAVGSILVVKIGLICLTAIYSLYFHPLRKIPGPKLWIAFPIVKSIAQLRGQLDFQIRAFHEKYGEVVRIGPDAVTFTSPQAWKDIYGHGHAELAKHFPRGTAHGDDGAGASDIISANARDHFRFRRAMLPAFSGKALEQQEPLIQVYVDLLVRRLREVAEAGEATDMVRWYTFTTFDLIGDLAYGEPFGGLESGKSNAWVESIEKMMKLFPILVLANTSPLLSKVFLLVAGSKIQNSRREHLQMVQRLAEKRIKTKCQARRGDFMDFLMRSQGQEHGLSNAELISNSDTLIVAGSETTATLLSGVTYHLLNSPAVLRRCVDEVRRAFGSAEEISFQSASASLPYMRACLDEALRLFPPIPTVLFRQTSPGPATVVDGLEVPEKVWPPILVTAIRVFDKCAEIMIADLCRCASSFHLPLRGKFPPSKGVPPGAMVVIRSREWTVALFQRPARRLQAVQYWPTRLHRTEPRVPRDAVDPSPGALDV